MSDIHLPDPKAWAGAVRLTHLGVILAEGADTATFLHGQLSQDVTGQSPQEARLAAFCSAKGRMQASLLNLRPDQDTFWLLADKSLIAPLVKRLGMFVLRAKAKLRDASEELAVLGLVGETCLATLGGLAPSQPWEVIPYAGGLLSRLPDVLGCPRCLWMGPPSSADQIQVGLPQLDGQAWAWLEVMSGIPRIEAATIDQFVPQMINFELIGGVNFKKGCYPGQEVVARSQYRGTTKRRAFVVHGLGTLGAGQEVFSANDPAQPAGMVINAAAVPGATDGLHSALIELKLSEQGALLHVKEHASHTLSLGTQPYTLPTAE